MKPVYETAYRTGVPHGLSAGHDVPDPPRLIKAATPTIVLKPGSADDAAFLAASRVFGRSGYRPDSLPASGVVLVTDRREAATKFQKVWHPNVIAQQVQQTNYVPQTVAEQVPMQVVKYMPEQIVRKVPIQVCRMVTSSKSAGCRSQPTRPSMKSASKPVSYQVCRMVAEQQTIRVPHTVEKRIPVTYTYNVAPDCLLPAFRSTACGNPIVESHSGTVNASSTPRQEPDREPRRRPATPTIRRPSATTMRCEADPRR